MAAKDAYAPRPPMGWNSWDCYGAAVTEEIVLGNAAYMAQHMKEYGWEYIVVDIQWSEPTADGWDYHPFAPLCMDEFSRLIPAENRFPSAANGLGFAPLAQKVHALGLKLGIHIMRGIPRQAVHQNTAILGTDKTARQIAKVNSTCPWNGDMYGVDSKKDGAQAYYDSLFALYASWGVDYVKVDDIANTEQFPHNPYAAREEIEMIRHAIDSCGRPMVLSLSPGPAPVSEAAHLCQHANLWRMTGDLWDNWESLHRMFDRCQQWVPFVRPGCWPDCDMLPLGYIMAQSETHGHMTNLTSAEQRTMMTLWAIFRSPLMMGGELRRNDEWTLKLLTNPEVLYVNQHSFAGRCVRRGANDAVWTAQGEDGRLFVALFNTSDSAQTVGINTCHLTAKPILSTLDLWEGAPVPVENAAVEMLLKPHDAALIALKIDNEL